MTKKKQHKLYSLQRSPFFRLKSTHKLSEYIGCRPAQIKKGSPLFTKFYESEVKKENKKPRRTQVPFGHLRTVHERVEDLCQRIAPPSYLHSAYPGRSYVTHASVHRQSREIYCVDIQKFFPLTSFSRVESLFLNQFECNKDIATVMAKLLTHDGWLATGSPASAIIAFYAHKPMFDEIFEYAHSRRLLMSVLMDDICVSGAYISRTNKLDIRRIIADHGRVGHKEKHFPARRTAEVTGVIIKQGRLFGPSRRHQKTIDAHKEFRKTQNFEDVLRSYQRLSSRLGELGQIENRSKARLNRYKSVYQHLKRRNGS